MSETAKLRYHRLAKALLASSDPQTAIADLLGDHEGRLDALGDRLRSVEVQVEHLKNRPAGTGSAS